MDDLTLKIDTGAPVEVPAFEPDECGHNWLAVNEDRDPRAPGGLRRRFQPRAGVPFYYLVEGLKVGDVIEFGADRVSLKPSRQHRKQPKTVYGVIREINAELLRYTPQPNALTALAFSLSPTFRKQRNQAREEDGNSMIIAWIYRHAPLPSQRAELARLFGPHRLDVANAIRS